MAAATDSAPGGRSRKFFGQVTFTPSKRGYEQVEVDAFLEQAGHAIERLLQRLREAEALAGDARLQIESAEQRAQRAELQLATKGGDEDLIQRTLTLAERTAVAAVADAKRRAEEILQEANLEAANVFGSERHVIEGERVRLDDERQQLEALRLAVAAETHALDQVRANLRDRVAAAAKELEAVADAPDLLGYHIATPAMPTSQPAPVAAAPVAEVAAPEPTPAIEPPTMPVLEAPAPSLPPAEVLEAPAPPMVVGPPAPASEPPVMAPSVASGIDIVLPGETPEVEAPTASEAEVPPGWGQPDPSAHPAAGPVPASQPLPAAAPVAAPVAPAVPVGATASSAPEHDVHTTAKSFEAQWQQEATAADPAADRAFAQFFSDKVEQDPSQTWLQAAEAS
jgi:DivIVA domain-containing protein